MMSKRYDDEKADSNLLPQRGDKVSQAFTIVCQQGLLWSSLFVAGGTAFLLAEGGLDTEVLVSECFLVGNVRSRGLHDHPIR